ncbi:membrane dipeptidase [Martelella sp. FLE1502]
MLSFERDGVARHFEVLIDHLGEDGVALGSDLDGAIVPKAVGDVSGAHRIFQARSDRGFGDALVRKLAGENWLGRVSADIAIRIRRAADALGYAPSLSACDW